MHLFFIAGEASGDAHGAVLIAAIREAAPDVRCEGLGGTRMAAAGMELRHDLAGEAIMGFVEVLRHFPEIRRLFKATVARLRESRPDVLVLIDYPGFNIRIAEEAKKLGIRVVYYISPQVWAWKRGRIRTLARSVDKMLVIFPFEEKIYHDAGVPCVFVGHPLVEHLAAFAPLKTWPGRTVIGVLPGSRAQEVARNLPVMLEAAAQLRGSHPELRFVTPCPNTARAAQIRALAGDFRLEIIEGGMYDVLAAARFAWVASGTATLEAALFRVPMGIVYRVHPLTYAIAKRLVQVENIGIVNILAGSRIVPEFVQHEATAEQLASCAERLLEGPAREEMIGALGALRAALGEGGASARAAAEVLEVARA